eukprot:gene6867-9403_t
MSSQLVGLSWRNKLSKYRIFDYQHFNKFNIRIFSICMLAKNVNDSNEVNYEYIDSGNYKRLEKFGNLIIIRSCPSASWSSSSSLKESWNNADIEYKLVESDEAKQGNWIMRNNKAKQMIDSNNNWYILIENIPFNLKLLEMGQVGVFPEQQQNWQWIQSLINKNKMKMYQNNDVKSNNYQILNGFAYTGGSSIAALVDNNVSRVTHLDASKPAISMTKSNVLLLNELNKFHPHNDSIRYINDDCLTFLDREIRRNSTYHGIIFDPPAFGRGGMNGRKTWKLNRDLLLLMNDYIPKLLNLHDPLFILISCHDPSWTSQKLLLLLQDTIRRIDISRKQYDPKMKSLMKMSKFEHGELQLTSHMNGNNLPLGCFARWSIM